MNGSFLPKLRSQKGGLPEKSRIACGKMGIEAGCKYAVGHLGVSKNRGTPKWMVDNGKPY